MVTSSKIKTWYERKNKIEIQTTYKEDPNKNHWSNKNSKEILNKHWICDYCGMAIIIRDDKNKDKQDGGECFIPVTIMRKGAVKVVSHNRCLNKLIAEVEKILEEERKQNEEKNKKRL